VRFTPATRAAEVLAVQGVLRPGGMDELRGVAALVAGAAGRIHALDRVGGPGLSGRVWTVGSGGAAEWAGAARPAPPPAARLALYAGRGLTRASALAHDAPSDAFLVADSAAGLCRMHYLDAQTPLYDVDSEGCARGAYRALAIGGAGDVLFAAAAGSITRFTLTRDARGLPLLGAGTFLAARDAAALALGEGWLYAGAGALVERLDPATGAVDRCAVEATGEGGRLATRVNGVAAAGGVLFVASDVGLASISLSNVTAACTSSGRAIATAVRFGSTPVVTGAVTHVAAGVDVPGWTTVVFAREAGVHSELHRVEADASGAATSPAERLAARGVLLDESPVAETPLRAPGALAYVPATARANAPGAYLADDPAIDAGASGLGRLWQVSREPAAAITGLRSSTGEWTLPATEFTSAAPVAVRVEVPGSASHDDATLWDLVSPPLSADDRVAPGEPLLFTLPPGAGDGPRAFAAIAITPGLVDSAVSPVLHLFVDRAKPPLGALAVEASGTGALVARGETEPGATVALAVRRGGAVVESTSVAAGPTGHFEWALPPLLPGDHLLEAAATDRAGNRGDAASAAFTRAVGAVSIALVGPGGAIGPEALDAQGRVPVEIRLEGDVSAEAPVSLDLYLDGGALPAARLQATAPGTVVVPLAVAEGEHTVRVVATDGAGRALRDGGAFTLRLTAAPPPGGGGDAGGGGGGGGGGRKGGGGCTTGSGVGALSLLALAALAVRRSRRR
jgi:hypothetical protein